MYFSENVGKFFIITDGCTELHYSFKLTFISVKATGNVDSFASHNGHTLACRRIRQNSVKYNIFEGMSKTLFSKHVFQMVVHVSCGIIKGQKLAQCWWIQSSCHEGMVYRKPRVRG